MKAGDLDQISKHFSFKGVDDLLASVGYARLTPRQVLNRLMPKLDEVERAEVIRGRHKKSEEQAKDKKPRKRSASRALTTCSCATPSAATPCPATPSSAISAGAGA